MRSRFLNRERLDRSSSIGTLAKGCGLAGTEASVDHGLVPTDKFDVVGHLRPDEVTFLKFSPPKETTVSRLEG